MFVISIARSLDKACPHGYQPDFLIRTATTLFPSSFARPLSVFPRPHDHRPFFLLVRTVIGRFPSRHKPSLPDSTSHQRSARADKTHGSREARLGYSLADNATPV